ncbi:MAG TPA: tryptophan--tRNA ligase, partial [Bacillota bacterium]|nr:tryptophan--tRNA ligase [Bacillota bacterium]
ELRKRTMDIAAMYLACGLEKNRTVLFIQSEIKEHVELGYILQSNVYMGELERMTQYKDKVAKQETSITSSLFTYPALMAADIILYDADYVPVGEDQKQHLELTRTIAQRFNNYYGDFFTVPEPLIPEVGARIMDLQNPDKKMSKSEENEKGYITMFDDAATIRRKIRSAVTDSLGIIKYDPENQKGLANLLTIYASATDREIEDIVLQYKDSSYKEFKDDLAEVVCDMLIPIQERYLAIVKSNELQDILNSGRDTASEYAYKKMLKCKRKVGLGRK